MAFDSVATNCRLVIHTVDLPATLIWVPNKGTWSASRPVSFFKVQRETKRIATKNGSQLAPLIRSGSPLVLDNGTISTLYHYHPGTRTLVRFRTELAFHGSTWLRRSYEPIRISGPRPLESVAQGGAGHLLANVS